MRCPICLKRVNLGAERYCPHVLCHGGEGTYIFAPGAWDFQDDLQALYDACEAALDDLERLPTRVRPVVESIVSNGPHYWRDDVELHERSWTTDGMLGGFWQAYFHQDPGAFSKRVSREVGEFVAELRGA